MSQKWSNNPNNNKALKQMQEMALRASEKPIF
jgi:hypothetical protein